MYTLKQIGPKTDTNTTSNMFFMCHKIVLCLNKQIVNDMREKKQHPVVYKSKVFLTSTNTPIVKSFLSKLDDK